MPWHKLARKLDTRRERYRRKRRLRQAQTLIVSYPKSGRTWVRAMLADYICRREGIPGNPLDLYSLSAAANLDLTEFSHEQAHHHLGLRAADLHFDKAFFRHKKVLFLHRDPRDTAVSLYYQLTRREQAADQAFYPGSLSDLLRDDTLGLRKIMAFNQLWLDNGGRCKDFLAVSYEDISTSPEASLLSILAFLGEPQPCPSLVAAVCRDNRFSELQRKEKSGQFVHFSMGARQQGDETSLKVRKGKVGGYKQYFSEEDERFATDLLATYTPA